MTYFAFFHQSHYAMGNFVYLFILRRTAAAVLGYEQIQIRY